MSPVEHNITSGSIDCLHRITRCLGNIEGVEVFERLSNLSSEIVASRGVVRMSKDTNIGMQRFQCRSSMLIES